MDVWNTVRPCTGEGGVVGLGVVAPAYPIPTVERLVLGGDRQEQAFTWLEANIVVGLRRI